jgi:hypothetical protein
VVTNYLQDLYKERVKGLKLYAESDAQKKKLSEQWEKKNDPSPFTYKTEDSYFKTQAHKRIHTISKSKDLKFIGILFSD